MSKHLNYIDLHGHVNFDDYGADREAAIQRAREAGVGMVVVGTTLETSKNAIELAERHGDMWATVGLHPTEVSSERAEADTPSDETPQPTGEDRANFQQTNSRARRKGVSAGALDEEVSEFEELRRLALHPKVAAIGECGLDYFHAQDKDFPAQKEAFERHIAIANEAKKPLMLHVRSGKKRGDGSTNAYKDALEILAKNAEVPFNFHFFAGSREDMQAIFEKGGTVSFTGVITFTHDYDDLIKAAPLEKVMIETDCPYVAPAPHRGKRNEPAYAVEVAKAIARIRGEDSEAVRRQLLANAFHFLGK